MYAQPNARLLIDVARTNIDRIPLSGEVTDRDEDVLESPSRTVSVASLLQYINDGQRLLAEECKAMYLTSLVTTYSGALSGFDQELMARPLVGRVERDDGGEWQGARFRKVAEHNYLESSGRSASPQNPAYTYDGGEINVYPGDDPTVRIDYVQYPAKITVSDVPSDSFYVSGSDALDVGALLTGPLAMYVTAKASRSIERMGMHDLYMDFFARLVRPLERTWRLGAPEQYGRSRVDEPESNTEV